MTETPDEAVTETPVERGRRRLPMWLVPVTGGVALVVLAVVLGTLSFATKDTPTTTAEENLQVVEYQTPSDPGPDPFTTAADVEGEDVIRFTPAGGTTGSGGSEPFGGSGSLHVCDREALVDFLLTHDAQRRVWAGVLKINDDEDSVSRYVRSLTPVTITVDTRVTNHTFVNGRAVPFQSILAAGTAVLVDKYGRPVVRCKCGNPLWWPIEYPKVRCKGCPPKYDPPKPCTWRIYDPWYGYDPTWLPPDWRDPYPESYPKPKPWVYKDGKYCYVIYPSPPQVDYPPRWYPEPTFVPPRSYPTPKPTDTYDPPDEHDDSDDHDDGDDGHRDDCGEHGCVNIYEPDEDGHDDGNDNGHEDEPDDMDHDS